MPYDRKRDCSASPCSGFAGGPFCWLGALVMTTVSSLGCAQNTEAVGTVPPEAYLAIVQDLRTSGTAYEDPKSRAIGLSTVRPFGATPDLPASLLEQLAEMGISILSDPASPRNDDFLLSFGEAAQVAPNRYEVEAEVFYVYECPVGEIEYMRYSVECVLDGCVVTDRTLLLQELVGIDADECTGSR
jgi:hypothetical protein